MIKIDEYIGFSSIWQQLQKNLHPELLNQLEYRIGTQIIEDSVDHYNSVAALVEILVQKIQKINSTIKSAEQTQKLLPEAQPSLIQLYSADLLKQQNLEQYFQQKERVNLFLKTKTIQNFKNNEQKLLKREPLAAQELNYELNDEFINKVKKLLEIEHKELDQRSKDLMTAIYDNHKLERIARGVLNKYKEAEAAVSISELQKFSESLRQLKTGAELKSDEQLLDEMVDAPFNDNLAQSMRISSGRNYLKSMDSRPVTGMLSIKAPPRPLSGISK